MINEAVCSKLYGNGKIVKSDDLTNKLTVRFDRSVKTIKIENNINKKVVGNVKFDKTKSKKTKVEDNKIRKYFNYNFNAKYMPLDECTLDDVKNKYNITNPIKDGIYFINSNKALVVIPTTFQKVDDNIGFKYVLNNKYKNCNYDKQGNFIFTTTSKMDFSKLINNIIFLNNNMEEKESTSKFILRIIITTNTRNRCYDQGNFYITNICSTKNWSINLKKIN